MGQIMLASNILEKKNEQLISVTAFVMANLSQQDGTSNTYKAIADTMRRHPDSMHLTNEDGFKNICSLKYAYPTVSN